ncbi:MAG: hypothetical protein DSY43_00990 [Gammaproteobacteria bacterium]|nr:MAG: hypothetical protein DSY43_00990 [Gammaproteobacteria bacterium]
MYSKASVDSRSIQVLQVKTSIKKSYTSWNKTFKLNSTSWLEKEKESFFQLSWNYEEFTVNIGRKRYNENIYQALFTPVGIRRILQQATSYIELSKTYDFQIS